MTNFEKEVNMNYQGGLDTFREATRYMFEAPSISDVLFVLLGLSFAVGSLIVLPYIWSKYMSHMDLKKDFFNTGRSLGLSEAEISMLWKCASKTKEPVKVLQVKAVFERCINKLAREDVSKIDLITEARKKLRFDTLPWFLPLTSTRDIDLYQTGFITISNTAYSAAVWDRNELELHIALLDTPPGGLQIGDKVKFSFLREGDGRYYFQSEVTKNYIEGGKLVLVLQHTHQLSKIQLRESLRWRVKVPVKVQILHGAVSAVPDNLEEAKDAVIEDISVQGARVCFRGFVEISEETKIYMVFQLKKYSMKALGTVKNVRSSADKTCLGVKFEDISDVDEDHIRKFITEEQRELLKAYKMGELK